MDVGEVWLYHPSKFDATHPAQILNIGKTDKVRVRKPSWLAGESYKLTRAQLPVRWNDRAE